MNLRARRRILKIGDVAGEVVEIGLERTAKVETVGDAGGFGARDGRIDRWWTRRRFDTW